MSHWLLVLELQCVNLTEASQYMQRSQCSQHSESAEARNNSKMISVRQKKKKFLATSSSVVIYVCFCLEAYRWSILELCASILYVVWYTAGA